MQTVTLSLILLSTLALAGCQSKAEKVNKLLAQYNAASAAYARGVPRSSDRLIRKNADRRDPDCGSKCGTRSQQEGTSRMQARADRLAQIQREILAAQQ
jgi:uncharacterized Fe-S cluster-containing protein